MKPLTEAERQSLYAEMQRADIIDGSYCDEWDWHEPQRDDDELAAFKGIVTSVCLGAAMWIVGLGIVWAVW